MSYAALLKQGSIIPFTDLVAGMFLFNAGMHCYLHGRVLHHVDYVMPWGKRPEPKDDGHH